MDRKENERVFRLPSDAHNFDNDLYDRAKESVARKSLLPLLKDELRLKIQTRRLSQGLDELKVDFEHKPQTPELVDLRTKNVQLKDKVFQLETEKEFYISKLFNTPEIVNIFTEYYGATLNSVCEVETEDVL
ncbi:uncharacterized protein LOC127708183 isoform X2 [Mytilus californianus]|uniref:uncharacterized protein LOC127708183 isoform X2 n=1 Tax=Mytilus californianus TaxID=6549 RepID=UPI0022475328|nr:uncharacterized protein LOC127708183 isoform X2 [Mytilus californianus]